MVGILDPLTLTSPRQFQVLVRNSLRWVGHDPDGSYQRDRCRPWLIPVKVVLEPSDFPVSMKVLVVVFVSLIFFLYYREGERSVLSFGPSFPQTFYLKHLRVSGSLCLSYLIPLSRRVPVVHLLTTWFILLSSS